MRWFNNLYGRLRINYYIKAIFEESVKLIQIKAISSNLFRSRVSGSLFTKNSRRTDMCDLIRCRAGRLTNRTSRNGAENSIQLNNYFIKSRVEYNTFVNLLIIYMINNTQQMQLICVS